MKTAKISYPDLRLFLIIFQVCFLALILSPQRVQAQDNTNLEAAAQYNQEELAQMLAPVALYPDTLLSQILMASTYPIEIIEADRWVRGNRGFKGERLDDKLLDKDWDPSVKALCHFPAILALLSERISETTALGNAFLAQEAEVLDMIQRLREEAYAQGNLTTTSEQRVLVDAGKIVIQPADPRVVYVPYYDPYFVYGPRWWSPAYPPYYWGPAEVEIGAGIFFWPGISFGIYVQRWSYFDWFHHYIYIDVHKRPRFVRHDRWVARPGPWSHLPSHRRGVTYRDRETARKYGQEPPPRTYQRDSRDFPEHKRIEQRPPQGNPARTNSSRPQQPRSELRTPEPQKAPPTRAKEQLHQQLPQKSEAKGVNQPKINSSRPDQQRSERRTSEPQKAPPTRTKEQLHPQLPQKVPQAPQREQQHNSVPQKFEQQKPRTLEKPRTDKEAQKQPPTVQQPRERVSPEDMIQRGDRGKQERPANERGR